MLKASLLVVFLAFSSITYASGFLVISAPNGLVSSKLLEKFTENTGVKVYLHPYLNASVPLSELAVNPSAFDLLLLDRSYIQLITQAGFAKFLDGFDGKEQKLASDITHCPAYAFGQTVMITNKSDAPEVVTWPSIVNGDYGAPSWVGFSSVTEAGKIYKRLFSSEKCENRDCFIDSFAANLRIIKAKSEVFKRNNPTIFSLMPDYSGKQVTSRTPGLIYRGIEGNEHAWIKHWCVTTTTKSSLARQFLEEIYKQELIDLNEAASFAKITPIHRQIDLPVYLDIIEFPGSKNFHLYSELVGVRNALNEY